MPRRLSCLDPAARVVAAFALAAGPAAAAETGLEGRWKLDAYGSPAQLEFTRQGGGWTGRADFGAVGWEPIIRIVYNPATGDIAFHRVRGAQDYVGRLSGNRMEGKFSGSAPWHAVRAESEDEERKAVGPEISIEGKWKLSANRQPAKLEFWRKGGGWAARADFGVGWEPITNVTVDSRTKAIRFYRVRGKQQYNGKLASIQSTPTGLVARTAAGTFAGVAEWSMTR